MTVAIVLVLIALWVTLFAWAVTTLVQDRRTRRSHAGRRSSPMTSALTTSPRSPRPNVLFWFMGALVFGAGLLATIGGASEVLRAMDHPDVFGVEGAEALADAESMVVWGAVTLTVGAYIWRGARHRGWRDRLGRIIIVIGYLMLGVALSQTVHSSVDLWAAESPDESDEVLVDTMVQFLGWGVPAALLVFLGTRMAKEKILMTAHAGASF